MMNKIYIVKSGEQWETIFNQDLKAGDIVKVDYEADEGWADHQVLYRVVPASEDSSEDQGEFHDLGNGCHLERNENCVDYDEIIERLERELDICEKTINKFVHCSEHTKLTREKVMEIINEHNRSVVELCRETGL